jgi:excisionase family DNA binding protein
MRSVSGGACRLRHALPADQEVALEALLTARQVAEYLGLRENWVYDRAIAGDLPSYKLGGSRRFRSSEIEAWLRDRREPGTVVDDRAPSLRF